MSKKLTCEFIKKQFEKEGYTFLTTEYRNNEQKLDYICPKGHEHGISWGNWCKGKRCPYCANRPPISIEFVRLEFEKEKYKLLTTKYKNNKQKLEYVCPEGHRHDITWDMWQQGQRCFYCFGNAKLTIEFIRSEFKKEEYKLLTAEYINCRQKLNYICPSGHRHSITWGNWFSGKRCPYCAGKIKQTIEFIRSEFAKEGYILLTVKYKNNGQKLSYICPEGHRHSISWNNWYKNRRCPYCVGIISKGEIQVRNFIESLGIEILANDRNQILNPETGNGLELDIFIPNLNKAIEYNGEYWHQDKDRDLFKQELCESKGINLLTVWDREWLNDNEECKDKIKSFVFGNEL